MPPPSNKKMFAIKCYKMQLFVHIWMGFPCLANLNTCDKENPSICAYIAAFCSIYGSFALRKCGLKSTFPPRTFMMRGKINTSTTHHEDAWQNQYIRHLPSRCVLKSIHLPPTFKVRGEIDASTSYLQDAW